MEVLILVLGALSESDVRLNESMFKLIELQQFQNRKSFIPWVLNNPEGRPRIDTGCDYFYLESRTSLYITSEYKEYVVVSKLVLIFQKTLLHLSCWWL